MKQVILGGTYNNVGDIAPCYTPLRGNSWASSGLPNARCKHPWSVDGAFKNLYVQIKWPQENPASYSWPDITFTLYINDTPTALTVTVPAASGGGSVGFVSSAQNTDDTVTIAAGDNVALVRGAGTITPGINNSAAFIGWSLTFESDNAGESGYGVSSYGSGSVGVTNLLVSPPFYGLGGMALLTDTPDEPSAHSIVPLEGSLSRLDVLLGTAPGAGAARVYAAMLNQVLQDGSGGTVDTRLTISDSDTTGFVEFDLPMHVLDQISICQLIGVGTPAASSSVAYSVKVTADNDGESALGFMTGNANPTNDGTTDFAGGADGGWAWTTARAPTPFRKPVPLADV